MLNDLQHKSIKQIKRYNRTFEAKLNDEIHIFAGK